MNWAATVTCWVQLIGSVATIMMDSQYTRTLEKTISRTISIATGSIAAFALWGCALPHDPTTEIQIKASELFDCPLNEVEVFSSNDLYIARGCNYAGVFTVDGTLIFGESTLPDAAPEISEH